jgi:hypothetical protein
MTLDRVAILLTGSCAFFTFPGDCPARLVAGRNGDSVALGSSIHSTAGGELDPVAPVGHLSHSQRDLALLGELAGIAQEIEQNLPQPQWIGADGADISLAIDD